MPPPSPTKIVAVHVNYASRAAQRGLAPDAPSYFLKPVSSLATGGEPVMRPPGTEMLAMEGEIAVIIGRRARSVTPEQGLAHIGWFAAANDISLYDMRWADRGSNLFAKGQDGFTPLGAPLAADSLDPASLQLRTRVNGVVVQEDAAANLIFSFGMLVADLSRFMTLEPGDVILTGTPAGSPVVEPGDEVEVEVAAGSSVSTVISKIVEAPAPLGAFGAQPKLAPATRAAALGTSGAGPVRLSEEAEAALRTTTTATLTVQLAQRGIGNAVIAGLHSTHPQQRLLGYAYTLRYVPLREDVRDAQAQAGQANLRAVESIGPSEVLVIDARQEPAVGTIGDILAARAMARGANGIVTDGGLRDVAGVARLDFPVYYRTEHPAAFNRLHFPLEVNVPIACGGALVMPGDVLVGDIDGVVVIPAAMAEEVARDALEQESREAWAVEQISAGAALRGVYPLTDERRGDYELWRSRSGGAEASA